MATSHTTEATDLSDTVSKDRPGEPADSGWRNVGFAKGVRGLLRWIDRIGRVVVVVALIAELFVVLTDVGIRMLYDHSLLWSDEASKLCLSTLAFLGGALAYRAQHHTAIELVTRQVSRAARLSIEAAMDALVFCVAVTTGYVSFELLSITSSSLTPILQISASWIALPFSIGMILVALFALERLIFEYPGRIVLRVLPIVVCLGALLVAAGYVPLSRPGTGVTLAAMLFLFFITIFLGLLVSFAMLLGSIFFLQVTDAVPMIATAQNMVDGTGHFILLTLPFFILAGLIMEKGGISVRLVRFAMALVGHLRGGLLQVAVVTIYFVSGISGSKVADVVAVGSVIRRELEKKGYRPEDGAAVLAASAAMSETIPPSIAMLVLGSVAPISIGTLFIAGLLPAAVIALLLMGLIYFMARRRGTPRLPRVSVSEFFQSGRSAILPLLMPVIMIVGIKYGIATPTEVSAVAVVYGIALTGLIYRSIDGAGFYRLAVECALLAGMILFIVAAAGSFGWTLTAANLPQALLAALHLLGDSPALFLIGSMILLIVVGSLLEGLPALIILGPLLMPIANQLGIDSIHYSMVIILAMGIGIFIPPIGIGFYIACAVTGSRIEPAAKTMVPYLVVLILGVLAVAFVPWFTHVVPSMFGVR